MRKGTSYVVHETRTKYHIMTRETFASATISNMDLAICAALDPSQVWLLAYSLQPLKPFILLLRFTHVINAKVRDASTR